MANPDDLTQILRRTPEMQQAPGLAIAAYQAGGADPVGTSQVLAHAGNMQNTDNAIGQVAQHHGGRSLLGQALGGLGHAVGLVTHPFVQVGGEALHLAGAPLREVQHQYRYLHDVGVRHGPMAAFLEGLAITGAGVAGTVLSGGQLSVGVLAAETAGGALSHVMYKDSYDATEHGEAYLDPHTHGKVSVGRDIGHLLGLKEGSTPFTFLSGTTDGIADLFADPLAKAGKLVHEARTAQGLRGVTLAEEAAGKADQPGIRGALGRRWGGLGLSRPEDVDRAYKQYGSFRRAVADLSSKSTGEIVTNYPKLQGIAKQLGNAKTEEEVLSVFRDHEVIHSALTDMLPTRGRLSAPLSVTKEKVLNWGGLGETTRVVALPGLDEAGNVVTLRKELSVPGRGAGIIRKATQTAHPQWYDPNALSLETGEFAPRIRSDGFRLGDDHSFRAVFDSLRMGGMSRRAAQGFMTEFAEADPGQRLVMFRQGILRSMLQLGLPEDSEAILSVKAGLQDATGGSAAGVADIIGYGPKGEAISPLIGSTGGSVTAPLTIKGGGLVDFPQWDVVMKATRDMHAWSARMGAMDEWAYRHYTTKVFKRAVLLSMGFAFRVAAGEVLPRALTDGFRNYVKAGIISSQVKLGLELSAEETPHIEAAVAKALGFTSRGFAVHTIDEEGNILGEVTGNYRQRARAARYNTAAKIARVSPADYELATKHVTNLGGQVVSDGLSAGHYYAGQIHAGNDLTMNIYKGLQEAPSYRQGRARAFHPDDNDAPEAWRSWVKEQANDPLHQTVAEKYDEVLQGGKPAGYKGRWDQAAKEAEAEKQAIEHGRKFLDEAAGKAPITSQPDTYYHVSDAVNAEGIAQNGLTAKAVEAGRTPHVYAWKDLETAKKYATADQHIYEFQASGEQLNSESNHYVRAKSVEPERLQRVDLKPPKPNLLADHPRHTLSSVAGVDPHEDWARTVLQNIKGATHGPNGEVVEHTADMMQQIAAGIVPTLEEFHVTDVASRPLKIKGHELQPMWGNDNQNIMARWSDSVHQKILTPMINKLAREPLFFMETKQQWEGLAGLRAAGMTDAEAITLAQQRAGFKMSRYIHNLEERSQFAESWRNFMPFFFAQQQAWGRAFRLLAEDPGAFRKYQLLTSMFQNVGHVQKDADGVDHIVYPGTGFLGKAVPGIMKMFGASLSGTVPVSFTGDIRSLGSVLPLSETQPGMGPIASVPLNLIKGWFPELKPGVDKVLGEEGSGNMLQSLLMPNATIRRLWQSQMGDNDRAFVNSSMQTIQYLSYKQEEAMREWTASGHQATDPGAPNIVPSASASPVERQEFLDKVKRQSRVNFFMKAVIGALSPMSPQLQIGDMKLNDQLSVMIKKDGFALGLQNFMEKNPDASPYEVFGSETTTNTPLSASSEAGQFMTNHMGLLKDYQYAAWLIPQNHDNFSQEVYQEQLSQGLRTKRAPQDVLTQIYIARGNHDYFDVYKPEHDKVVKDLTARGDKVGLRAETHKWSQFIQNQLGPQNPVWFHDFMTGDRDAQRKEAVQQLTDIFDKGLAPDSSQSRNVKSLLDDYNTHAARMPHGPGTGPQQAIEEANWQKYLETVIADKPEMKSIIQKVFKSL